MKTAITLSILSHHNGIKLEINSTKLKLNMHNCAFLLCLCTCSYPLWLQLQNMSFRIKLVRMSRQQQQSIKPSLGSASLITVTNHHRVSSPIKWCYLFPMAVDCFIYCNVMIIEWLGKIRDIINFIISHKLMILSTYVYWDFLNFCL